MLEKIRNLGHRFVEYSGQFPLDRREFGWRVSQQQFWDRLLLGRKSKRYIRVLSSYMIRELEPLVQKYNRGEYPTHRQKQKLDKIPVWVCWWQGEEQMPDLVKACVNRLRDSLPRETSLHIISWDNVERYVTLPDHVLRKHREGLIGLAHLSDVLRFGLLSSYGGVWIDATVYLSGPLPRKLYTEAFHTQCFANEESCPREACRGKWCGFFLGGQKDNVIFPFMYEALCYWWSHHDRVVDYVFFDYILWAAYCGVPQIRKLIDAVPPGNEKFWDMWPVRNKAYDPVAYQQLLATNEFFKLSYNGEFHRLTQDGKKTVYTHILEENHVIEKGA